MMSVGSRDASVREAKVFAKEVVRNDWDFEVGVPPASSADGSLCHNREVCEWRVREFDSSTSELEPQTSDSEDEPVTTGGQQTDIERRRKRRRQMDDEMAWNEGLRVWMARRNAWSGAKTQRQIRTEEEKRALAGVQTDTTDQSDGLEGATGASSATTPSTTFTGSVTGSSADLATRTETSLAIVDREKSEELQHRADLTSGQQGDQEEEQSTAPDEETKGKASSETNITEPDASDRLPGLTSFPAVEDQTEEEKEIEELDEPLVPVAPPFIPDTNPVRATIVPSIYPSIYSKVVVQGMTPTMPVNLAHLTKAMVQGWKADGQWPPKPAVTSIVLTDNATVPKKPEERQEAPTGRRKNSITNAVKKVFHFGHPFHRRGSQSQDAGNGA
ncbi:unnamed protein product [Penicillium salamii]|uniref:Gag1-like clamp domain-containing protein n=1 Tax=Penicillium salamii TaxID=1612424 RepID=A0A9W4IZ90_9EURO|nr:unnamed protein product [Penicillium salamii]CAG8310296.1 unnamed protein product [Penicillium salamii]CAG8337200.1 unnamed protein product [Penicillium salamii]CAG8363493.1 unnamed protein product [Penicillium salamii]CAG8373115.1 unnamed protein product [Penicillium salamii]